MQMRRASLKARRHAPSRASALSFSLGCVAIGTGSLSAMPLTMVDDAKRKRRGKPFVRADFLVQC